MAKLIIDLNDTDDLKYGLAQITSHLGLEARETVETEGGGDDLDDIVLPGEGGDEDDLLGMMDEEESTGPTLDDVKAAVKGLAQAKGSDAMKGLLGKAFAKLGVKKLDEIPEDKRQKLIDIVVKATNKK